MKLRQAQKIIERAKQADYVKPGYRVSFEVKDGALLRGDFFPESSEALIPTLEEAEKMAREFAKSSTGMIVNIRVVDSQNQQAGTLFLKNR